MSSRGERESEVMRRCRRARQELFARFKTADELFAWVRQREKEAGPRRIYRIAKAQAHRKTKPPVRNGKPTHGKPVHRA
jgi:hypothetical protein